MIEINSKSRLAQYKQFHREAKQKIQDLEIQLLEAQKPSNVISLSEYKADYERRVSIHDFEVAAALKDFFQTFKYASEMFGNVKAKTVELFPITK